jgi:hypothetical protein
VPAVGVGAAHPGEALVQVATSEVVLDDFIHHRPKEPVLLLAIAIIEGFMHESIERPFFSEQRALRTLRKPRLT